MKGDFKKECDDHVSVSCECFNHIHTITSAYFNAFEKNEAEVQNGQETAKDNGTTAGRLG